MSGPNFDLPGLGPAGTFGLGGTFTSGMSFGRPRLDLGDYTLKLDPEIMADLAALRAGMVTPGLRQRWMDPDWSLLDRAALGTRTTGGDSCAWSAPGRGPKKPRAATAGDAMKAVYRVPCVRKFVDARLEWLERRGTAIWDGASTGGKAGIATGGVLVVGSAVVGGIALGPLSGVDLPVPKVPGLSARVSLGEDAIPPGFKGLPADGAWSFSLTLDLAKIVTQLQ